MTYGRVDVYWPDGPIESHRLEQPTVAVGRSTGNDITLDTTAISRYHITFALKDQQVLLEDLQSVNGTYVDGVRLAANEPYILRGGEEIQIGDVRLIFHPAIEIAAATEDTTQRITLSQPTYRIELQGPDISIAPGAHAQATLKIDNVGDDVDHYFVEIDGLPRGWARVDRTELEIDPGEQGQMVISFKPLRRSESQPGDHPFVMRVRSRSNSAQTIDVPTMLRVLPYGGFGIALGTPRLEDGTAFKLYIHNQGNAPLPLTLQGTDPVKALRFRLAKTYLTLGPGERQTVTGTVKPRRRRVFGQEHEREFALIARSQDASNFLAAVPGTYVDKGLLPTWAPALIVPLIAMMALLLAGVILLVFFGGGDDQPAEMPPPVIAGFVVSQPAINLGESVHVAWDVQGAETLELRVTTGDALQQITLDPVTRAHYIEPEQTGRYEVALVARRDHQTTSAAAYFEVKPVVALDVSVMGAAQLVRYVHQRIVISWDVAGARELDGGYSIWVESSDRIVALLGAPLAMSGAQEVDVLVTDTGEDWRVTLYAEGRDDLIATTMRTLGVVNPTCDLKEASTTVRSGPGETYPAVLPPQQSSPEGTLSLSPTARDPGGGWLQVTIGVTNPRTGWVRLEDFACTNFDPDALRITDDFPPPANAPTGDGG